MSVGFYVEASGTEASMSQASTSGIHIGTIRRIPIYLRDILARRLWPISWEEYFTLFQKAFLAAQLS